MGNPTTELRMLWQHPRCLVSLFVNASATHLLLECGQSAALLPPGPCCLCGHHQAVADARRGPPWRQQGSICEAGLDLQHSTAHHTYLAPIPHVLAFHSETSEKLTQHPAGHPQHSTTCTPASLTGAPCVPGTTSCLHTAWATCTSTTRSPCTKYSPCQHAPHAKAAAPLAAAA